MIFSIRNNNLSQKMKIIDIEVLRDSNVKHLGIFTDDKLLLKEQLFNVKAILNKCVGIQYKDNMYGLENGY